MLDDTTQPQEAQAPQEEMSMEDILTALTEEVEGLGERVAVLEAPEPVEEVVEEPEVPMYSKDEVDMKMQEMNTKITQMKDSLLAEVRQEIKKFLYEES